MSPSSGVTVGVGVAVGVVICEGVGHGAELAGLDALPVVLFSVAPPQAVATKATPATAPATRIRNNMIGPFLKIRSEPYVRLFCVRAYVTAFIQAAPYIVDLLTALDAK